ncbi:gas vesicle protein GvpO [Saccharopolyspora sp. ASAGF58]|uniref:gas vesicle protein GvpO n=1 Tax=Saccharopolyspora sp. ASAGF58 TaxID=2719023 RepID=UPI001FF0C734|nr:gas vesicle protein GvpO [Saccharopolyspora sp. ASAGF58]
MATVRREGSGDREPPAERRRRNPPRQPASRTPTTKSSPEQGRNPERARQKHDSDDDKGRAQEQHSLKAAQVARLAVRQVHELTGRQPEGVTSLERSETGWVVGVEVVESRRVPDTADVLAVYEAELDDDGDLVSYRRVDRYARGRGNER